MKKYTFQIILSLCIGCLLAYLIINSYDDASPLSVSSSAEEIYYLQKASYTTKEAMEDDMQAFGHYIYNVEDNMYNAYIGISANKKGIEKIKNYYQNKGYNTDIKTKITDNENFITVLKQYDTVLLETEDEKAISTICNQVLTKYEEMVAGEYQN